MGLSPSTKVIPGSPFMEALLKGLHIPRIGGHYIQKRCQDGKYHGLVCIPYKWLASDWLCRFSAVIDAAARSRNGSFLRLVQEEAEV
jgi:hypothetical protein